MASKKWVLVLSALLSSLAAKNADALLPKDIQALQILEKAITVNPKVRLKDKDIKSRIKNAFDAIRLLEDSAERQANSLKVKIAENQKLVEEEIINLEFTLYTLTDIEDKICRGASEEEGDYGKILISLSEWVARKRVNTSIKRSDYKIVIIKADALYYKQNH